MKDLLRLLEATRAVASTLRLSEVLATVMRLAGEVARAEASSLLLLDPATGELYFDVALGEKGGALRQVRLKKGEGIAGWVAENRAPAVVNDVAHDPRWMPRADQTTAFETKSILAVPMQAKEKLIGVMEVINRSDGVPFDEGDAQILGAFAAQAAVAIENARLFESVRQEKEKMATILAEMAEGAVLVDAPGRILLANPAAGRLLGRPSLDGSSWPALEDVFTVAPTWEEARREGGGRGLELSRKAPPPLFLSGIFNRICNDRGQVSAYLMVFRDVTEERREAQLKKNFISLISHKLRTPLVAIRGFAPLLLQKPEELTPLQKNGLEAIDRNSQRLASLVDKLIGFAALEAETLDLARKPVTYV